MKPHCPVPVITYNGNLIVAAANKYPKVAARLPAGYLTETTTALGKIPTDVTGQKIARGETGNLTAAQQANLDLLLHSMGQARKTAKLAFPGQTVKLHQEFQIGIHDSHELNAVLSRADIILAADVKLYKGVAVGLYDLKAEASFSDSEPNWLVCVDGISLASGQAIKTISLFDMSSNEIKLQRQ